MIFYWFLVLISWDSTGIVSKLKDGILTIKGLNNVLAGERIVIGVAVFFIKKRTVLNLKSLAFRLK